MQDSDLHQILVHITIDLSLMTYFWLIHPNFDKLRDIKL